MRKQTETEGLHILLQTNGAILKDILNEAISVEQLLSGAK
jgi:hypothetical protein